MRIFYFLRSNMRRESTTIALLDFLLYHIINWCCFYHELRHITLDEFYSFILFIMSQYRVRQKSRLTVKKKLIKKKKKNLRNFLIFFLIFIFWTVRRDFGTIFFFGAIHLYYYIKLLRPTQWTQSLSIIFINRWVTNFCFPTLVLTNQLLPLWITKSSKQWYVTSTLK